MQAHTAKDAKHDSSDDDSDGEDRDLKENLPEDDPLQMHGGYVNGPSMGLPKSIVPEKPPLPSEAECADAVSKEKTRRGDASHLPVAPDLPCLKSEPPPI